MRRKGGVLILILWILAIFTIFSIAVSFRAAGDIKLARYESDKIKAAYLARAGVMKMLSEIIKDSNDYDSLNEDWNRGMDDPKTLSIRSDIILYGASDEDSRLNLNSVSLSKEHLVMLGLDEALAEGILKYKTKKAGKGFEFPEELFLVKDVTRDVYSAIEGLVTIYRGSEPSVNINTADAAVIKALLPDDGLVSQIIEHRKGPDGEEGTVDDGIFRYHDDISAIRGVDPDLFSTGSKVFRIWARVRISGDKGPAVNIEAVMDRSGKTYNWKEF
jgi:type II secretory pathway component PulK